LKGLLSPEGAALSQTSLSTCWLTENGRAAGADDDCLCVGENGGDCEAAGALDIHEEGAGSWNKVLWIIMLVSRASWGCHFRMWRAVQTLSLCLRASAAGVGLRRSTARTYFGSTTLAAGPQIFQLRCSLHPKYILLFKCICR